MQTNKHTLDDDERKAEARREARRPWAQPSIPYDDGKPLPATTYSAIGQIETDAAVSGRFAREPGMVPTQAKAHPARGIWNQSQAMIDAMNGPEKR